MPRAKLECTACRRTTSSAPQASLAAGIVDAALIPEVPFTLEGPNGLLAYLEGIMEAKGGWGRGGGGRACVGRPVRGATTKYVPTIFKPGLLCLDSAWTASLAVTERAVPRATALCGAGHCVVCVAEGAGQVRT